MKSILFSIVAVFLYSMSNVILELRLSKYQTLTTLVLTGGVLCLSAFLVRLFVKGDDPSFAFPTDSGLLWAIAACLIFAVADWFYISAYTSGGDLLTITSIVIFFPMVAATIKLAITGHYPNLWQVAGWGVMVCGVLLMAKGVAVESAKLAATTTDTSVVATST